MVSQRKGFFARLRRQFFGRGDGMASTASFKGEMTLRVIRANGKRTIRDRIMARRVF